MVKNESPLQRGMLAFVIMAIITIALEAILVTCDLSEIIAFFCPYGIWEYGSDTLIFITVACLVGLLAGFLVWLNHTLNKMRSSYGRMITELKTQVRALEEKLDTMEKD